MAAFSTKSKTRLKQAHPDLQRVMNEAIKHFDFSVIEGYRNRTDQNRAYRQGKSRAQYGQSPHNFAPSLAVDCVPYPLDWNDIDAFNRMGAVIMSCAAGCGVQLVWGKTFSFRDYPHFELLHWREMKGKAV